MASGKPAIHTGKILPPGPLPIVEDGTAEREIALSEKTSVAIEPAEVSPTPSNPMLVPVALPGIAADSAPVGMPVDSDSIPHQGRVDPRLDLQSAKPIALAPAGDLSDSEATPPVKFEQPVAKAPPIASPGVALSPVPFAATAEGQDRPSDRPSTQRGPDVQFPAPALQGGPSPAALPQPEFASDLPQPVSVSPVAGTPTLAPTAAQQADLAAVVDRLAAARAALTPLEVTMDIDHPEFGEIGINFRQDRLGALTVNFTSADTELGRTMAAVAARAGSDGAMTSHHDGSAQSQARGAMSDRDPSDSTQRGSQSQRETSDHPARRSRTADGRGAATEAPDRTSRHGTFA